MDFQPHGSEETKQGGKRGQVWTKLKVAWKPSSLPRTTSLQLVGLHPSLQRERLFFFSVTRVTRTILWSQQSFLKCERGQRPALSIPPLCSDQEFAIQIPATPEQAMSLAAVKSILESSWGCVPRSCRKTRWTELEKNLYVYNTVKIANKKPVLQWKGMW